MKKLRSIKSWPHKDRPREKLLHQGEGALTNTELLAILIRTGSHGNNALDVARMVLQRYKNFRGLSRADGNFWRDIKGLGSAKAAQIRAALEIGRRFGQETIEEKPFKITSADDVAALLMPGMRDLPKEVFKIILLNARNQVMSIHDLARGTVTHAYPIIREVLHHALQHNAATLICAHNHPSGFSQPSHQDREFTIKLRQACLTMEIPLLDHVIIGDNQYYSFAEQDNWR